MAVANSILRRLGLFVVEDFLDAATCERLIDDARSGTRRQAGVYFDRETMGVDEEARQTKVARVPSESTDLVKQRLESVKPELEQAFGLSLTGSQEPQFLVYDPGDFFHAHTDAGEDAPEYATVRKVSAVVFLNPQSDEPNAGSYSGGSLVFSGLLPGLDDPAHGLALAGRAGSLLAFRSSVVHEVKPVTSGERYTVVTWFF